MSLSSVERNITKVRQAEQRTLTDELAIEEPLEIRVQLGEAVRSLSVTMRTPGHDRELATGFLFTEGLLQDKSQILSIQPCGPLAPGRPYRNIIRVHFSGENPPNLEQVQRNFYTTSSCGVCGKSSIEAIKIQSTYRPEDGTPCSVKASLINKLPDILRRDQEIFSQTGGLHAAALFSPEGHLVKAFEDVGRHNALDKLVGWALLKNRIPLYNHILMLSGRGSFELMQKAAMAGLPIVAAVGAPSSLAVDFAREWKMTLLGFVRDQRFNVYAGEERLHWDEGPEVTP